MPGKDHMSDKYGPSNPPRLRKDWESVDEYRNAMGWQKHQMMLNQDRTMKFDPATGAEKPYPSHADQWRNYHGALAWLFNPWTGERRNAGDVGTDCYGLLIIPCGDALTTAQPGFGRTGNGSGVGTCAGLETHSQPNV